MITQNASQSGLQDLRRQAADRLKTRTAGLKKISPQEAQHLLQELHIHQVELEMQNEQLRQTQAELETTLAKYTDLYDFAPVAYLTLDPKGWVLEANLTAARLLGTERTHLVQQPLVHFIRPADAKQFWAYLAALVRGEAAPRLELNLHNQGGVEITAQLDSLLVKDAEDNPQVRISVIDITPLKRSEENLKNQMHFIETLIETIPSPVFYKDVSGRYLGYNQAFQEFCGKRRDEAVGKYVYEMGTQEIIAKHAEMDQKLLTQLGTQMYEGQVISADGSEKEVIFHKASFLDASGKVGGLIGIIMDITALKRGEAALIEGYEKLKRTLSKTVQALSALVERKDPYTSGHQRRVGQLAEAISQEMGLSHERPEGMQVLGLLHDIGKVAVPAEILSKPTKLNRAEFDLIKEHPQVGYDILKDLEFPWPIATAVLQHHERLDGSGYPQGLSGPDICLCARILAVADVVEAMASFRPYRPARGIDLAVEEITRNKGLLYDPQVVDACVKLFAEKEFTFYKDQ